MKKTILVAIESMEPANFHRGIVIGFLAQRDLNVIPVLCPRDVNMSFSVYDELILSQAKKFKIDYFFACQGEAICRETIQELNRKNVKTVVWQVDDPYILTHTPNKREHQKKLREFQFVYTTNMASIENLYPKFGIKRVKFMPFGYDPECHKNLNLEKKYNATFVGSGFKARTEKYFNYLTDRVVFVGCSKKSRVCHQKMIEIANQTRVNLNFSDQPANGVKCLKNRVTELLGAGQFVLSEDFPEAKKMFEENKEIVLFSNVNELKEKMDYYIRNKKERLAIAETGYKKVASKYSYKKLMARVLEDAR